MSHMGHNSKVPIRIHDRYLQIILRFAKCGPPCEGRGKWIMDYRILVVKTDPKAHPSLQGPAGDVSIKQKISLLKCLIYPLRRTPIVNYIIKGQLTCFFAREANCTTDNTLFSRFENTSKASGCNFLLRVCLHPQVLCCSVLQCAAVCCSVLHCAAYTYDAELVRRGKQEGLVSTTRGSRVNNQRVKSQQPEG